MKPMVLLIDDDKSSMKYYVKALERKGFKVERCYDPDETFEFLENEPQNMVAILLDIMMLPGERYQNEDTQEGLTTGTYLYDELRGRYPDTPIVILTNVSNQETHQHFREGPLTKLVQKIDSPPFELAQLVMKLTQTSE